jgi:NAD(P)-dependent dehydrogenase (short-subunit alcohol dehydrogenase family)
MARAPAVSRPAKPHVVYPEDGSVQPVRRLVWHAVPAPPVGARRLDQLAGRRVLVLGGSDSIRRRLSEHGAEVVDEPPADGVIDFNVEDGDEWRGPLRRTVEVLKACYAEWIEETDCTRRFYVAVTSLGGTVGCGDGDVEQPLGGIWVGLAKTLPRELPNCNVRVLDLAPGDRGDVEERLLDELYQWGLFEIGYRDGRRLMVAGRAEDAPPPRIALGEEDTILVTGGSRGIGFALARGLAGEFGCRVVVTGRSPLPAGEPWLALDEAGFKAYEMSVLKAPPHGQTVAEARRGLERLRQLRELAANLDEAQAEGLPVEYAACDFTDAEQLRALLDRIGPGVTGVVHNASVSAPTRLPGKSTDAFLTTVEAKVGVFFDLFESVSDRPLKFFCNVGSLVGRWGGMIGEIDYAAANAGLSIAGAWAAARAPFPVQTVCWPTWERLGGMIKNFDVTLSYMSALDVDEGVYRWKRELVGAESGESVFVGRVGRALFPAHVKGFPPSPDLPNIGELYTYFHYLGDARSFRPFQSIESSSVLLAEVMPAAQDVRLGDAPALPVSVLLEYALSVGDWVQPEPPAQLHWRGLRDLEVELEALAFRDGELVLVKRGAGAWRGDEWVVDVELGEFARVALIYSREPPPEGREIPFDVMGERETIAPQGPLTWKGFVYRPAQWRRTASGALVGLTRTVEPADVWATPFVPQTRLPGAELENVFRAAAAGPARTLRLASLERFEPGPSAGAIVGADGAWSVLDDKARVVVHVVGLAYA